jgi:hypothetical protein
MDKMWGWMRKNYDWSFLIVSFAIYTLANNPWPFVEAALFWKKTDAIVLSNLTCRSGKTRSTGTFPYRYQFMADDLPYESYTAFPDGYVGVYPGDRGCFEEVPPQNIVITISYDPQNPQKSARAGWVDLIRHFYIYYIGFFAAPIFSLFYVRRFNNKIGFLEKKSLGDKKAFLVIFLKKHLLGNKHIWRPTQ